ncbi:MAG: hypothetical protein ACTSSJ_06990 [Candidatus Odinarchaeia archaeon]
MLNNVNAILLICDKTLKFNEKTYRKYLPIVLKYFKRKLAPLDYAAYLFLDIPNVDVDENVLKDISEYETVNEPIFTNFSEAFMKIKNKFIAFVSCRFFNIDLEVLKLMFSIVKNYTAVIPRWPNGKIEPLFAVYNKPRCVEKGIINYLSHTPVDFYEVIKLIRPLYLSTEAIKSLDPKLSSFSRVRDISELEKINL